jgi:serine/threonine protein kinase
MKQLSFRFEDVPVVETTSKVINMPENKIEIVNPIPLDDLYHMVSIINKGHRSEEFINLERLGSGAFGTVVAYKNYAIKYIRDEDKRCTRDRGGNKISDELSDATILKDLQHIPCIVKLYAVIDNIAIIVEKVDGMIAEKYSYNGWKQENFINIDFAEAFENALKGILHKGYYPKDLHAENVMIDRKTGMPVIIDVGLFAKIPIEKWNEAFSDIDFIDVEDEHYSDQAVSWNTDRLYKPLYYKYKEVSKKAVI